MIEELRYVPIHDLPDDALVDERYIVGQSYKPLWLMLLLVPLGRFPRPKLVHGRRHWSVCELIAWSNMGETEMYYEFQILARVDDPDPEAAAMGCSRSVSDSVNAETVELAVYHFKKKYPTVRSMRVICEPLNIDIRR